MYKSYLYYATDAIGHRGSTQTRPTFSLRVFSSFFAFKVKLEENNLCITDSFSPHSLACFLSRVLSLSFSFILAVISFFHSQLSNLGDVSLHKLFKNNILHYNVCIIYRGHLIRIKFVKQHRKIALTGPGNMITATQCRASII